MRYQPTVEREHHWQLPRPWVRVCWLAIGVGIATAIGGALTDPARVWLNLALVQQWALLVAAGGLALLGILAAVGAGWHTAIRRVPEAMAGTLPLAIGLTLVLGFGLEAVYPWANPHAADHGHHLSPAKAAWLSPVFVLARVAVCLGVWWWFAHRLRRHSLAQDTDRDPRHLLASRRLAIGFLVAFGPTFSLVSFDLMMSIDPHWFSTIFAVYQFFGALVSAVGVLALLLVALRVAGALPVRDDHLHNVGKLLLAFAAFQAWVGYCQYMLIWYANMPEETGFYVLRTGPGWLPLFVTLPVLAWVVPVALLLPRAAKRNKHVLAWAAAVALAGQWLDRFLLLMPAHQPDGPRFGFPELGLLVGLAGAFLLAFFTLFARHKALPVGDPRLPESQSLHT